MVIETFHEIKTLERTIYANTISTYDKMKRMMGSAPAVEFFAALKFSKIGVDPLQGTELNLSSN